MSPPISMEPDTSVLSSTPFNSPPSQQITQEDKDIQLKLLVQPEDVQVKRVGRASCIEPELKLSLESDALYPMTITLNAYLKVLGKDNKYKMILLRKSDDIMLTKVHRREMISMKLRFLKTIKVQVLKRNLCVARPEAYIIFEVVNKYNEVLASVSSTHFVIISDPRYLDEVKKRRGGERDISEEEVEADSNEEYYPSKMKFKRANKKRRLTAAEYEGPLNYYSNDNSVPSCTNACSDENLDEQRTPLSPLTSPPSSPSSPLSASVSSPYIPASPTPIYLTPLSTLRNTSDLELFADSEEEYKLIKLVESLKYRTECTKGLCNFQVLPPVVRT